MISLQERVKSRICNSPIVGSYRSGSSVLTWHLRQHSNILPLPETYWIAKLSVVREDIYKAGTSNGIYSHLGALVWNEKDFYAAFGRVLDLFIVDTRESRLRFILKEYAKKLGLGEADIDEWLNKKLPDYSATINYQVVRNDADPNRRWVDGTPDNKYHCMA